MNTLNSLSLAFVLDVVRQPSCFIIRVICPFCKKIHKHGGGSDDKPHYGTRVAHCCEKEYDLVTDAD